MRRWRMSRRWKKGEEEEEKHYRGGEFYGRPEMREKKKDTLIRER